MNAMIAFANDGGMIPEQIWDAPDIPRRELFFGRPSGSAMPLVWAHAEYVKLARSLHEERVFDMPPQTVERYVSRATKSPFFLWRFNQKTRSLPAGRILRIESLVPAVVHWSVDGWRTVEDTAAEETGMGVHKVDLPTRECARETTVMFTFFWPEAGRWEGADFEVAIE